MVTSAPLPQMVWQVAVFALPLLAAVVFHEVAHGAVAYALGDPTAARLGRLTLNPVPHIDPVGTLLVPALLLMAPYVLGTPGFVFGWARPVPIDVRRLRRPRRDSILVALAGPGTNLVLAVLSAIVLLALPRGTDVPVVVAGLTEVAAVSLTINCVLAVFNLFPIPPLDGGRVLTALLPLGAARALARLEGAGFVIVLLVVLNTDVLRGLVRMVMGAMLALAGAVWGV